MWWQVCVDNLCATCHYFWVNSSNIGCSRFFDVCASDIWNNMFQILQNNFKVYPQKIYRPSPTILWTSARCPKTSLRCHVRVMPLRLSSGKLNPQLPKERCFIVDQMGSKQFSSLYKKFCLHASNLWPFLFL